MSRAKSDKREVSRLVRNILAIYLDADELTQAAGRVWYEEESARALDFAKRHGLTLDQVVGAAAAISPGMRWELAYAYVASLCENPRCRVPTYSREFVRRAVAILDGARPLDVLSGPKVTAFYSLLASAGQSDAVVIDGHAWNIANGACYRFRKRAYDDVAPSAATRVTPRRYRLAVAAYCEAGEVLGEPAHSVQATTWIHWRNLYRRGQA